MAAEPAGAPRSPVAPRLLRIVCAVAWWWALWWLATGRGGALEASVAAGSWGLSLLPLHVTSGRAVSGAPARCRGRESRRAPGCHHGYHRAE